MGLRLCLGMLGVYNEAYAALKAPLFHREINSGVPSFSNAAAQDCD